MRFPTALCRFACCWLWLGLLCASAREPETKYPFDLPAAQAERTLKLFSEQSGRSLIVAASLTDGVQTHRVRGTYTAMEALDRMLADTGLIAKEDEASGAFSIRRSKEATPNRNPVPRSASKHDSHAIGLRS